MMVAEIFIQGDSSLDAGFDGNGHERE
jgi:hypothetical protein